MADAGGDAASRLQGLLEARLAQALDRPAAEGRIEPRSARQEPVPLSAAQRSMWLAWRSEPHGSAYNVPLVLRLRGPLDSEALLAAVRRVGARHDLLHCLVEADGEGAPRLRLTDPSAIPVSLRELDESDLPAALAEIVDLPFDLSSEPPMRVSLLRLGECDHVLAMAFHHIAVDAYARAAILRDLADCHDAAARGAPDPPGPRIQHPDYVVARPEQSPDAADLAWWRARLGDLPGPLDLPGSGSRSLPPWPAGEVPVVIDDELAARARAWAAAHGCSLFMVLLAALDVVLSKACGTTDVVVGTPDAGRPDEELRDMVGCFVNMLPLRVDLSGDPTGTELLARARDAALDGLSHATVPFGAVVAAINPDRSPRTSPVFQAMLNVYDAPTVPDGFAGVDDVESVELSPHEAKSDLVWHVVEHADRLESSLVHRTDMVDRDLASRISGWLVAVLDQLVTHPERRLASLVLEPASRPVESGPELPLPDVADVPDLVARWSERTPDALAVVGADHSLTYAELGRWAAAVARVLQARGVRPGDTVGILLPRGAALAAGILGIMRAGACVVPMDPGHPSRRLADIARTAGLGAVLTDPDLAPALPHDVSAVTDWPRPGPSDHVEPATSAPAPGAAAYAVFTSGSTGAPKGVLVSHAGLLDYLQGAFHLFADAELGERPGFALISTIAADLGFTNLFGAWWSGGTAHLLEQEVSLDPQALAQYLSTHRVDAIKMVPSHLQLLATHGDLGRVLPRRLLVLAGEACSWDLVDRIRAVRPDLALQVHYGPTETTVSVLGAPVAVDPEDRRTAVVPLGRPLGNVRCYVVDHLGRPVPPGVAGELWIGGPSVAVGYVGDPVRTEERFVPDPLGEEVRCYRSGDRVRVCADGTLEFLGRVDDQVKIRGHRVELAEVQGALRALPGVDDAIVLPIEEGGARRLLAWASGADLDPDDLRRRSADVLPEYMVPSAVVVLDALPLNSNGKIDRSALPRPARLDSRTHVPPRTALERRVAGVWCDVLGLDRIGVTEDFFALGGDSFLALRAVHALDPGLGMAAFFSHPTVESLAAHLGQRGERGIRGVMLHAFPLAPGAEPAIDLVCLPYAGGMPASYRRLGADLGPAFRLWAVELPGHDPAGPEMPLVPLEHMVRDLAEEVVERTSGRIAIYGHSAGSAAAVALGRELEARGVEVAHVVVGAQLPDPAEPTLSDEEYREALVETGALEGLDEPAEERVLRASRHDAEQARAWYAALVGGALPARLRAPLLCVLGEDDPGTSQSPDPRGAWSGAAAEVELVVMPGAGHYFHTEQAAELARVIGERLSASAHAG